jgi:hypothetical protein
VFVGYLRGIWRNVRFILISAVNFYYVINKLIILILIHINLVLVHHLKFLSIDTSLVIPPCF